jgi:hypothetical protein
MARYYPSQGKTAKFRIEMGPAKVSDAKDSKDFTNSEEGRFMAEPGSEASVLLVDLKKALEAKGSQPIRTKASNRLLPQPVRLDR